jgi:hypothetical protein
VALLDLLSTSSIIMADNSASESKLAGKRKQDNETSKSDKSEAKMQGPTLKDLKEVTGGSCHGSQSPQEFAEQGYHQDW